MPETKKHGFVVALDGPDGVGKTTQVKLLSEYLQSEGLTVRVTRSSGGTPIGEELRKVSLSDHPRPAETDLFISLAMGAALAEDIQARKLKGEAIIIDRSPLAVVAYNGYGSELQPVKPAFDACEILFRKYGIDLLLFLTAGTDIIDTRRKKRGALDYFESKNKAYHQRVAEGYQAGLEFLQNHPDLAGKVTTINASGTIAQIEKSISEAVEKLLK